MRAERQPARPRTPLRAAIVGAGLMGRWHADAASRSGAALTAIVDRDPRRAAALARTVGAEVTTLTEAIARADVIHVCTPTASHASMARHALAASRHVLVEKPLASASEDALALLDLADAQGVLLCPVHQFLFQDGVASARASLAKVAPLEHVAVTICSAGADGQADGVRDEIARDILPHPVSLLVRLAPAAWPQADWSVRHPRPGEIRALAEAGGVTAAITVSMRARPTRNELILFGAAGSCAVDLFHGFAVLQSGAVSRRRKIARPFVDASTVAGSAALNLMKRSGRREPAYPGLRPLVAAFYEAVRRGQSSPISRTEIVDTILTCDRLAAGLAPSHRDR